MASDTRLRSLPKRTPLPKEEDARLESEDRRAFLRKSAAMAGGALAAGGVAATARAAPLAIPGTEQEMGRPIPPAMYGMPSKYEAHVARRRSDVLVNRQNWSDWSMTPLQHQYGIITPNGLIYERHHAGTPDIDPEDPPARHPWHGAAAARVLDGGPDAVPDRVAVLLPRVLG